MSGLSLTADAALRGGAVELSLAWSASPTLPRSLRLVRRRRGYSVDPDSGRVILDLADLFANSGAGSPWGAVDVWYYTLDDPPAHGGGIAAELAEYYVAAGDAQPAQVAVRIYPAASDAPQTWVFTSVSRVVRATGAGAGFGSVMTVTIFTQPAGGAETLSGTAVVSTQPTAPGPTTIVTDFTQSGQPVTTSIAGPNEFAFTPASAEAVTATALFAREEMQTTFGTLLADAASRVSLVTSVVAGGRGGLPLSVTGASSGAPIAITTGKDHGLSTGASISIAGASGNTAANGTWTIVVDAPNQFTLTGSTGNGSYAGGAAVYPPIVRSAELVETSNIDTGLIDRSITLEDREARAGVLYYYTAYQTGLGGAQLQSAGTASVLATGGYAYADRLFDLLPSVHRYYDDPVNGLGGSWQLRRYLGVFGPALDYAESLVEALPSLADPVETCGDYLPHLGRMIGWEIDRTLPTERQRQDLLLAPEVYATIGAGPNVQALANRNTGWGCEVKEFVNNVFLTNAAEPVQLWQIFGSTKSGSNDFAPPTVQANIYPLPSEPVVTQADPSRVDGRPTASCDSGKNLWLFWHSTRLGSEWQANTAYASGASPSILAPLSSPGFVYECTTAGTSGPVQSTFPAVSGATVTDGTAVWTCLGLGIKRRRVWLQRLGVDPTPVNVVADLSDGSALYDESPSAVSLGETIVLAWASNRGGHNEIWVRVWSGASMSPGAASRLTQQQVDNRSPALACAAAAGSPISAVWQSTRSGQTMIWANSSTDGGATWSAPAPISPGPLDRMPSAVIDPASQLRVFWSAEGGGGEHIRQGVLAGGAWTASDVTPAEYGIYDGAPASVVWNGAIWLFWHSNRFGVVWQQATSYAVTNVVTPQTGNGSWYECTTAGTSGAAQPAFPTTKGATVVDGAVVWTCRGLQADAPLARTNRIWLSTGPNFATGLAAFARLSNDRQPAAVVEPAGDLRLFFTSQETGARFRSRTFDTSFVPPTGRTQIANLLAKSTMRAYQDRLHYTYDTRQTKEGFLARDTVGLYLTPNDAQSDAQHLQTADRLIASLTPYRPLTTRFVYFLRLSGAAGPTPVGVDP